MFIVVVIVVVWFVNEFLVWGCGEVMGEVCGVIIKLMKEIDVICRFRVVGFKIWGRF